MDSNPTPELILAQAEQLFALRMSRARAAELAIEVGKLDAAVAGAAERIDFNDDPARFPAVLSGFKSERTSG